MTLRPQTQCLAPSRNLATTSGIQVDQGGARKAKQKPEGEMERTKTTAAVGERPDPPLSSTGGRSVTTDGPGLTTTRRTAGHGQLDQRRICPPGSRRYTKSERKKAPDVPGL